jgi:2-C-methyl-D-erythritol 2,4-cyclodiphosphate synthase
MVAKPSHPLRRRDEDAGRHDGIVGALGDIGLHFPPGDARWEGADSRDLLRRVLELISGEGWQVINTDLTIVCEQPRIGPHVAQMRGNIASDLDLDPAAVSVKATTTEGLGFCGREEGIAAMATALLGARP